MFDSVGLVNVCVEVIVVVGLWKRRTRQWIGSCEREERPYVKEEEGKEQQRDEKC